MTNQETTVNLHPHDKLALELGKSLLTYCSPEDLYKMLNFALYVALSNTTDFSLPNYDIKDLSSDIWQVKEIISHFK